MGKTVYMLSSGCYSDYRVHAIFTTRKRADAFLAKFTNQFSEGRIEECILDPELPTAHVWEIIINCDGSKRFVRDITAMFLEGDSDWFMDEIMSPPHWRVRDVKPGKPAGCGVTDASFTVWCQPRDEEHGLKIARDAMRGVVAHGLWKHDATGPLA